MNMKRIKSILRFALLEMLAAVIIIGFFGTPDEGCDWVAWLAMFLGGKLVSALAAWCIYALWLRWAERREPFVMFANWLMGCE